MIRYLVRTLLSLAALALIFRSALTARLDLENVSFLMRGLAMLDLFHDLFYAMLPAALLVLLAPLVRPRDMRATVALVSAAALAALGCALLPLPAVLHRRPGLALPPTAYLASLYVALNLVAPLPGYLSERWNRWCDRASRLALLADVLLPVMVWSCYERRIERRCTLLRLCPAAALCLASVLPWLIDPLPIENQQYVMPRMQQLQRGAFYQVLVDQRDGTLFVTNDSTLIEHLDPTLPADQAVLARLELDTDSVQAVALDQQRNELLFSDPTLGQSYVIDAATLELKNKIAIADPIEGVPDKDYWCTLADRDRGWWIAQQNGKVALLNAAGDRVVAQHTFGVNFLDYYQQRDEVVLVSGVCGILALLDPRTFDVKKVVRLAPFPEKFALDQQTGIVYIAFPVLGRIMAFDLNENRIKAWIPSFPGVRTVAIDRTGRRLIAGGFAPLIEVRALDDFRLIERLTAPPWSRGLDVDQQRGRLYFTSALYGLWMLDLTDLPATAPLWQRIDPFYHLVRWADLLVQHASGIFGECAAFYEREGY